MSGDLVHANPGDVRKLAKSLQQYEQKVVDASKQAQKAIDRANWNDRQKSQFEERYRNFHKQTNSFVATQVRDFVKSLNALASDLERARSRRF